MSSCRATNAKSGREAAREIISKIKERAADSVISNLRSEVSQLVK